MLERSGEELIAPERWRQAQQYERAFWQRLGDSIAAGTREPLDWYAWRADQVQRRLAALGASPRAGRVLEIGSGPVGIINFFDADDRCALDPLEHFYRTQPDLVALRKPGVTYRQGSGEHLPFADGSCWLVIIDNVIDHTYAPQKILQEIRRVLSRDGYLYLSVNVHTWWGWALHTLLAALRIDKGHPFTFTSRSLRRLVGAEGFRIVDEQIEDYYEARRLNLRSERITDRIKGCTGLSEFSHSVICQQETRP